MLFKQKEKPLTKWESILNTLTFDKGKEFANHKSIGSTLNIDFYFAKTHYPQKRGFNENYNCLVGQFFPEGTYLSFLQNKMLKPLKILSTPPKKGHRF